ncbi:MAG: hypothetical protein GWO16_07775, partial [Gammaproteobacteria bacterium]|nr:hypothetical protein [Gammaproteobacteria bacterium]
QADGVNRAVLDRLRALVGQRFASEGALLEAMKRETARSGPPPGDEVLHRYVNLGVPAV